MQVAEIISSVVGADVPVRVIGYDGSKAGPDSSELALRINSPTGARPPRHARRARSGWPART